MCKTLAVPRRPLGKSFQPTVANICQRVPDLEVQSEYAPSRHGAGSPTNWDARARCTDDLLTERRSFGRGRSRRPRSRTKEIGQVGAFIPLPPYGDTHDTTVMGSERELDEFPVKDQSFFSICKVNFAH